MRFLLMGGISTLLVIGGLFLAPHSFGQASPPAPISDFAAVVQAGVQSLAANPWAQSLQQGIQGQDYKSAWDEFGTNALVDGSMPAAQVNDQITRDIFQSVETSQNYDQQEAAYLQAAQLTPEQVQAAESSTGADVPPDRSFNPNPSLDANPDASVSPADISAQDNTGGNAPEIATSTVAAETSTSIDNAAMNTSTAGNEGSMPETGASAQDANASTTDMSASSSESAIYDAILRGEQAQPADQSSSTPDSTADQLPPPADDTPPTP